MVLKVNSVSAHIRRYRSSSINQLVARQGNAPENYWLSADVVGYSQSSARQVQRCTCHGVSWRCRLQPVFCWSSTALHVSRCQLASVLREMSSLLRRKPRSMLLPKLIAEHCYNSDEVWCTCYWVWVTDKWPCDMFPCPALTKCGMFTLSSFNWRWAQHDIFGKRVVLWSVAEVFQPVTCNIWINSYIVKVYVIGTGFSQQ